MMYGFSGFGMLGGFLMMLLSVVFIVIVGYFIVQLLEKATGKRQNPNSDAKQILQERYARGEIDFETFEKMKQHLKQ